MIDEIVVPEGMLNATSQSTLFVSESIRKDIVTLALTWLRNNPIVPSEEEAEKIHKDWAKSPSGTTYLDLWHVWSAIEWQRRAFLRREPHYPQAVKDLLFEDIESCGGVYQEFSQRKEANKKILAAYNAGKEASNG
jgi:hypothetical protein